MAVAGRSPAVSFQYTVPSSRRRYPVALPWRQTEDMHMISLSPPAMTGALWTLCAAALLDPVAALAQRNAPPQNIVVDTTPSHAVSSFSPFRSLGAGIDRLRGD